MSEKTTVAAVEGLLVAHPSAPRLLGSRCKAGGTYYFPAEHTLCRTPTCSSTELESVELSTEGVLWSYTSANYKPPAPFVAKEPFEPFAIAAVTLEREQLTVLGQVVPGVGVDALKTGMAMELTLGTLHEDDEQRYLTWQWKPVGH